MTTNHPMGKAEMEKYLWLVSNTLYSAHTVEGKS